MSCNIFECPYEKEKELNVNDLYVLETIAHEVDRAFLKAFSMTQNNQTIHEADFVSGKVKEINALYDGRPHSWSLEYPLEEKLPNVDINKKYR